MSKRYLLFDDVTGIRSRGDKEGTFSNLPLTSTVTSGGTTVLTASSTTGQRLTGSSAHTVRLPDATTLENGRMFVVLNRSSEDITVQFSDATTASLVSADSDQDFVVYDNSGANNWDVGTLNKDSSLQDQIDEIVADNAEELVFTVSGTETIYNVSGSFTFDPSNLVRDIIVYKNVSRQYLSPTGMIEDGHYKKLDSTRIEFLYLPQDGDKVIIRKERTGGGLDLRNIGVNPRPAVSGDKSLGESTRLWSGIFVEDKMSSAAYEIGVSGGVLVAIPS